MPKADDGISTKVSVLGDKEYKDALRDIGRQITLMNSEMAASVSAFGDQENSMEALSAKGKGLQGVYDAQKEKVRLVAEQLSKAKAEYGENSTQAQNLQIALNKAQIAMNETATKISKNDAAMEKLATSTENASDETSSMSDAADEATDAVKDQAEAADDAEEKNSGLKDALKGAGDVAKGAMKAGLEAAAAACAALAAAAAAAVTQAFDMAQGAGKYADDLLTLSQQTSISAQTLQEWTYASNFIDTSVDTMTGSMSKMIKTMGSAANGSKTAQGSFDKLKVSLKDSNGQMRASEDVFWDAIDALGKINSETERDALAMEVFGKSAQDLNPLIEAGSQAFRDMGAEAKQMGTVFSDDALSVMGSFDDSMQKVKASGEALKNSIGLTVIPAFQPLVDAASASMADVALALQDGLDPGELDTLIQTLTERASGILDGIVETVSGAVPIASAALTTVIGALAETLPGLVETLLPAAMGLLQSVLDAIVANIEPLSTLATSLVTSVASFLIENASSMTSAATSLLTGLADGISESLPMLLPAAATMIAQIVTGLAESLPALTESAAGLLGGIVTGIVDALPTLVEALPQVITTITTALATALPELQLKGGEILTNVITGITDMIPSLVEALPQIFTAITTAVTTALPTLLTQGGAILTEIITGITGAIPTLVEALPQIFTTITTAIANALPDLLAKGGEILASIITGIGDNIAKLKEKMPEIISTITTSLGEIDWATLGLNLIQGLLDGMTTAVTTLIESIKAVFTSIWDAAKNVLGIHSPSTVAKEAGGFLLDGLVEGLAAGVEAVVTKVKEIFGKIWDAIKSIFGFGSESEESKEAKSAGQDIMSGMKDGITGSEETVKRAVKDAAASVLSTFKTELGIAEGTSSKTKAMGSALTKGIGDGLGAASADTFKRGADALQIAVAEAVNTAFGVAGTGAFGLGEKSAKEFEAIGAAVCKAVADGINNNTQNTEDVKAAITGVANAAYEAAVAEMTTGITGGSGDVNAAVEAVAGDARAAAADILKRDNGGEIGIRFALGVSAGIAGRAYAVASAAQGLGSDAMRALWSAIGSGGSKFEAIGSAIAQGMARGISGGAGAIASAARAAASSAYNAARRELDIHSPSRKMEDIGLQYDLGFASGIEKGMQGVLRSARQLSAMAAAETAAGGHAASVSQPQIDYEQLGEAVAQANRRAGVGQARLYIGAREMGETIEPDVSRAAYRRASKSVAGRAARMVLA